MLSCDAGQRQQPQLQASPGMMRVNSRNSRVQWLHAFSTFRGITLMQPDCNLRRYDSNLCCLQKYYITLASDQRAYNLSPISSSYAIQRCLLFELPQQFSGPFLWYWTLCFFCFCFGLHLSMYMSHCFTRLWTPWGRGMCLTSKSPL